MSNLKHLAIIILILKYDIITRVFAIPAYPLAYKERQPDGKIIYLKLGGDLEHHYVTDSLGYPVVELEDGWNVYAKIDTSNDILMESNMKVGEIDPAKMGFERIRPVSLPNNNVTKSDDDENWTTKFLMENNESFKTYKGKKKRSRLRKIRGAIRRQPPTEQISVDIMKNLVVLICFSDHDISKLPSPNDYDKVFNSEGPSNLALTGSIRDVFTTSSYGKLHIESTIYPWIQLSKTESYYANGNAGGSSKLHEALIEALNIIDADGDFDMNDFDHDKDKFIDSITFLHSGYGAEFGGRDCRMVKWKNRIWSHMWRIRNPWKSKNSKKKVKIQQYQISSGLWGRNQYKCEYDLMHIGAIAHEMAHFLGLVDQYGGSVGFGIGSYGLMGNAWGADFSQQYPPIMSPWNKIELGWIEPIEISKSGFYEITASYKSPMIYKIKDGYKKDEYLLIENRQPQLFDKVLSQGGLFVWHIDEKATMDSDGFPEQADWPDNGNHYINALLQADGKYDLETGMNYGDALDAFHHFGVKSIGPDGTSIGNYPNTDSYQKGKIKKIGHIIDEISVSGDVMTFRFINGFDVNDDYYDENDNLDSQGKNGKNKDDKKG